MAPVECDWMTSYCNSLPLGPLYPFNSLRMSRVCVYLLLACLYFPHSIVSVARKYFTATANLALLYTRTNPIGMCLSVYSILPITIPPVTAYSNGKTMSMAFYSLPALWMPVRWTVMTNSRNRAILGECNSQHIFAIKLSPLGSQLTRMR